MRLNRFLRASLFAVAAATAVAAPLPWGGPGTVLAEANPSAAAVEAVRLALQGDFVAAGEAAQRSGDVAAIKLVELIYLRDHPNDAGYPRIMAFLDSAPKWPLSEALMKRAERSLYANEERPELILSHFATRKPVTPEGSLALARALIATGDRDGARRQVVAVWLDAEITPELEKSVSAEFGKLLTEADHKRRMWRLVYAQETNAAIRAAKRLPGDYQKAAAAAQKLIRGEAGADRLYARLPSAMRESLAMKYALTRFYRSNENYAKARAILLTVPADRASMGDAEAWWIERRIIARHSVGISHRGSAKAAYQIAAAHGFSDEEEAIEGEFLAGWIALRYVKDAPTGLQHFRRLSGIAESRTEKARAAYWIGRAHEAMGQKGEAKAAYTEAAQYSTVYYGQLAREKIGLGKVPEEIETGKASPAAQRRIANDEVVQAFKIMAEASSDKGPLYMFLWSFANRFETTDEMNAVASVVWTEGGATMAVRLAKAAAQRNIDIDSWGYPIRALPDWKQIGKPVERPLVFALARQESEFNPNAGSKVGAQGLMQIMPGTAKLIAKQHGIKHDAARLMDPEYNVKLGAAHLGDLIADNGGSYVLTLVGYNAGPRRAREWLAEYGDFRSGQVDPIDWVESIPFQETRQYVQKVLQNLHVYRSRLAPKTVRPMTADLMRGARTDSLSVASTSVPDDAGVAETPATPAEAQPCKTKSLAGLLGGCD